MRQYCYWLLPAQEDRIYLQKIVNDLGKIHSAQIFIPHLTLYPFSGLDEQKAKETLHSSVDKIGPFHISTERIAFSEQFFKTVFIEFTINEHLRLIQERLGKDLSQLASYEFKPHISLLYKEYPLEKKQSIAESLQVRDSFLMDEVVLIDLGETEEDINTIENWKIIYNLKLQ